MADRGFSISLAAPAVGLMLALFPPSALGGDAQLGRQKAKMCQTCHGIDGLAKIPSAPHIAGESELYLVTQLKAFRSGKRTHEIMSLIAQQLSDEDIDNLAAWYSSIKIEVTVPD
ncbi:MAG: cytochrome c [Gemmataceae bacterium]|nr:cytochrome c [Gemmataceae bacterium]